MRASSERSGQGDNGADAVEPLLSVRIKTLTAAAHRGLEARTGWPETLVWDDDVATMLRMFRALHSSLDAAHVDLADVFREHGFARGSGSACGAIDDDLSALGTDSVRGPETFPSCLDFDRALGLHYVASGSAMGNLLILRHVAAHPRSSIAGSSRFLQLSASRAVPEFRAFRAALDRYGCREPAHVPAVVAGAEEAFRACVTWLDTRS